MLVTPAPVCLLIAGFEFVELDRFVMFLRIVRAIRLIFTAVPFMIVIVFGVVVSPNRRRCRLVTLGAKRCGRHCHWCCESGTQQGRVEETGNRYFHTVEKARVGPGRGTRNNEDQ